MDKMASVQQNREMKNENPSTMKLLSMNPTHGSHQLENLLVSTVKLELKGQLEVISTWPTSSLVEIVEAGVLGSELGEVAVPMPELGESPSPATSCISFARMARSLAKS